MVYGFDGFLALGWSHMISPKMTCLKTHMDMDLLVVMFSRLSCVYQYVLDDALVVFIIEPHLRVTTAHLFCFE